MQQKEDKQTVLNLQQSLDHHEDFSYDLRYLDALAATLNISSSPCAAVITDSPGIYKLSYNISRKQLLHHEQGATQPRHEKLLPYFIHDLNSKKVDALLGKYLAFSNNASTIFNLATDRCLHEPPFFKKILEIKATFRKYKADICNYKFSKINLSISNVATLDEIKDTKSKISTMHSQMSELQPKADLEAIAKLGVEIEEMQKKVKSLSNAAKSLSNKLTFLISQDKIKEAIENLKSNDKVLSPSDKEKIIGKLDLIQNFEERLAETAKEYKEMVLSEARKPENQEMFFSPDSKSPFKYLLRPIQDTAKLIKYFTLKGIVIRKMQLVWPDEVAEDIVKHCEEILHEKFPAQKYIGISHLSCASCTKALPQGNHRGDSHIAFEGTTHFAALAAAYEERQAEMHEAGTTTMLRTISIDSTLWDPAIALAGEALPGELVDVAA